MKKRYLLTSFIIGTICGIIGSGMYRSGMSPKEFKNKVIAFFQDAKPDSTADTDDEGLVDAEIARPKATTQAIEHPQVRQMGTHDPYALIQLAPGYQHDKWDIQPKDQVKQFRAYTVSFDGADNGTKVGMPEWVAYHMKRSPKLAKSPKRPSRWIEDTELADIAPGDDTYKNSGYSRGHLCMKHIAWRLGANADWNTHTTLNACPQLQKFNAGIWLDLEVKTEKWADKHGEIWVVCGYAFNTSKPVTLIGDKARGEMRIPVPHYFWKIIAKQRGENVDVLCFLYPHKEIAKKRSGKNKYSHEDYAVSVDHLERLIGYDFFRTLPDEQEDELERQVFKKVWSW